MKSMEYADYKYIMNDLSKLYFGAALTYGEACEHDYMPFKMKAVYKSYFKLADKDMTIAQHLMAITPDSLDYMAFQNMGAKVKLNVYSEVTDKKGNTRYEWIPEVILSIDEFVKEESYHEFPESIIITELIVAKLKLMTFSV